ncbi:MAG: tetratricopeptide repeat protein [Trueperaceae bacterium]|nr:tetratricopeptide repeat protein [Trueperaceae bacterium]
MRKLLCLGFFLLSISWAQSLLEQMQSTLDDGYYAVAAQVLGPELVADSSFSENAEAHYLYANALFLTSNIADARAQLDQAISLSSTSLARYDHLNGLLYAAEGRFSQALETLRVTFEKSADYETAMDWGRIAWQAGNLDEALEAFGKAAETSQGQKELWPFLNRGRILKDQANFDGALEAFNQAIEVFSANDASVGDLPSPGYVEAFYQLGTVYEALGNVQEARLNYESAITIGANYPLAVQALERLGN